MKNLFKNKKILISLIIVIFIIALTVGGVLYLNSKTKDEEKEPEVITSNYTAYVNINPLIKLEYTITYKDGNFDDPIVTKYELINDDANDIYKDIDLLGINKNLDDVLLLIVETAKENNIVFDDVTIYTNWNGFEAFIDNRDSEKAYTWAYIINIITNEELDNIPNKIENETFTITFDTDGGNEIESQTVKRRNKVIAPTNPTKKDYTFVEWQLDGERYDFNIPITKDITLIAIWKKVEAGNSNSSGNSSSNNSSSSKNRGEQEYDEDIGCKSFRSWNTAYNKNILATSPNDINVNLSPLNYPGLEVIGYNSAWENMDNKTEGYSYTVRCKEHPDITQSYYAKNWKQLKQQLIDMGY